MTRELTFRIDKKLNKPIIFIDHGNGRTTSCLLDTGANIPVWMLEEEFLKDRYPDAVNTDKKTILNGLGDKPMLDIPIWRIPEFVITDDKGDRIAYMDLLVAVTDIDKFSFDMIIPLIMINRMKFSFDYTVSAVDLEFKIYSPKDKYYVRPVFAKKGDGYLNMIQIFANE